MNHTFLLNDFYTIISISGQEGVVNALINLNAEHPVFKGHFVQMPVVPGVCQTQIIKELLQESLQENLILIKGNNIKFMGTIIPSQNPQIQVEIAYKTIENNYVADAKLFYENTTFTKFKGEFISI